MKFNILIFLFILLSSNIIPVKNNDAERDKFISEFVAAVKKKDESKVMQMLDDNYVKEQHDQFLKGNTRQFLDELFSGYTLKIHTFQTIKFHKIKKISFSKIGYDEGSTIVSFLIQNKKIKFIADLYLIEKTVNGKRVFGLRGAVG